MKPRMLVVEDSPTARDALRVYFEVAGFEVVASASAAAALELIARESYGVVMTDLRLAGASDLGGLEVVRTARARYPQGVVLLLSAHAPPSVCAAALEAGANAVIDKSLSLRVISGQVRELISAGA